MPERFDASRESFESFTNRVQPTRVFDPFDDLLEDLFLIRNPRFKFIREYQAEKAAFIDEYRAGRELSACGEWFYFPWNGALAHYLPKEEHLELRTARNRNIITGEEQSKLYDLRVSYAGLSVGSHGALTFAHLGGARRVKIADPDVISPSNLNRIRYSYLSIGRKKSAMIAEHLYELDPYMEIEVFDGVDEHNIDSFLKDTDVLVEETDNLELKIRLRLEARKRKIPVIMATDNADNIIFDVERYDETPEMPLFNGAIGDITLEEFREFPPHHLPKLATKIAGVHFVTERMMSSLLAVGKTIYSWPQLGDAATLSGVAISYALKRLALGEKLPSGKSEVNLDAVFDPEHAHPSRKEERENARAAFMETIGLLDD